MPMTTIAVINQKGGTGKTTTAVNLAAGLARKGSPVLLVDMDPQAHATYGLGVDLDEVVGEVPTMADVFIEEGGRIGDIIKETKEPNLKLAPSDIRLARAASALYSRNFRENVLTKVFATIRDQFDYTIIDCPPNLDVLAVNALVAADKLLIPTQMAGHSLRGLSDLLATITTIKGDENGFEWRILLTMVTGHGDERQQQAVRILEPIREHILNTRIRRTEAIEKSQMETGDEEVEPIVFQKKWSRGKGDYNALVKEIIELWPH